jgi:hypothetical protein
MVADTTVPGPPRFDLQAAAKLLDPRPHARNSNAWHAKMSLLEGVPVPWARMAAKPA